MPDLPPNIRALLAEKYPPLPRAMRQLTDALPRFGEAVAQDMTELVMALNALNAAFRQTSTCRLCGRGHAQHHSGCPLERP